MRPSLGVNSRTGMGVNLLVVDAPNWDDAARVQDGVKKTKLFQDVEEPLTYVQLDPASTNANPINELARQQHVSFILISSSLRTSVHGPSSGARPRNGRRDAL